MWFNPLRKRGVFVLLIRGSLFNGSDVKFELHGVLCKR